MSPRERRRRPALSSSSSGERRPATLALSSAPSRTGPGDGTGERGGDEIGILFFWRETVDGAGEICEDWEEGEMDSRGELQQQGGRRISPCRDSRMKLDSSFTTSCAWSPAAQKSTRKKKTLLSARKQRS